MMGHRYLSRSSEIDPDISPVLASQRQPSDVCAAAGFLWPDVGDVHVGDGRPPATDHRTPLPIGIALMRAPAEPLDGFVAAYEFEDCAHPREVIQPPGDRGLLSDAHAPICQRYDHLTVPDGQRASPDIAVHRHCRPLAPDVHEFTPGLVQPGLTPAIGDAPETVVLGRGAP